MVDTVDEDMGDIAAMGYALVRNVAKRLLQEASMTHTPLLPYHYFKPISMDLKFRIDFLHPLGMYLFSRNLVEQRNCVSICSRYIL